MNCSHVFEIVQSKDYRYCDEPVAYHVSGNPFCYAHGARIMSIYGDQSDYGE